METDAHESDVWSEWLLHRPEDRQFFEQMVRPTVESGNNVTTDRADYMQAQRQIS